MHREAERLAHTVTRVGVAGQKPPGCSSQTVKIHANLLARQKGHDT
jgi:hypothetical protein